MSHTAWTKEQKAAHIMAALEREDLPLECAELIQGWIAKGNGAGDGGDGQGEGDALMDAILDRMFSLHAGPTDWTRESFARLSEKLGLSE